RCLSRWCEAVRVDGKPAVAVAVNACQAAVVVSPENRAELQERLRRLQEQLPQPSLPAANTPTLPTPQMQPDGSTEGESVGVADPEPSVIATAEVDPPKSAVSKDEKRSRNFLVG